MSCISHCLEERTKLLRMEGKGRSQGEYIEMIRADKVKERAVTEDMIIVLFIIMAEITKRSLM